MKQKPRNPHSGRKPPLKKTRDVESPLKGTGRETKPTRETFPKRTKRPGQVGLANEARPGLGTRAAPKKASSRSNSSARVKQDKDPLGRNKPVYRPEPREQPADTFAHELERTSGVSGHLSAD